MAYNIELAERVRKALHSHRGVTEKKMFGGLTFLLHNKMCCGILKDDLVVRVGPEQNEQALKEPHARPMDFTGRPMKGFIYISPAGCRTEKSLLKWIQFGLDFANSSVNLRAAS